MSNLAELLKAGIKTRVTRFGTATVPATVAQRTENLNRFRRESRHILMFKKRNIPRRTITPVRTPRKTKTQMQEISKIDKRAEKLKQWKIDKKKRIADEKATRKPIFKVQHIESDNKYNLDDIYQHLKGKPIKPSLNNTKAVPAQGRLVPTSTYKFKPPANIKPIFMNPKVPAAVSPRESTAVAHRTRSHKVVTSPKLLPKARRKLIAQPAQKSNASPKTKNAFSKTVSNINIPSTSNQNCVSATDFYEPESDNGLKSFYKNPTRGVLSKSYINDNPTMVPASVDNNNTYFSEEVEIKPKKKSRKSVLQSENTKTSSSTGSSLLTGHPLTEINSMNTILPPADDQPVTPKNKISSIVTYVSPFVTLSRGKDNARKEYHRRSTRGGLDFEDADVGKENKVNSTSPQAAAAYFRRLLNNQIDRLQTLCNQWNAYKEMENPTEEVCDIINVAIGQTDLLLRKKFKQFEGLIESCELGTSEKPITCHDLHGFWDTVLLQVENLDKRYDNLESLRKCNWEEILPPPQAKAKTRTKRQPSKKSGSKATASLKAAIQEARKKKQKQTIEGADQFFLTCSSKPLPAYTPEQFVSRRSSLRTGILTSEAKRRLCSSTTKITKAAETPSSCNKQPGTLPKSILKSHKKSKSRLRKSRVVLFKDGEVAED